MWNWHLKGQARFPFNGLRERLITHGNYNFWLDCLKFLYADRTKKVEIFRIFFFNRWAIVWNHVWSRPITTRCFNYGVFLSRVLISIEIYLYPAGINLLKVSNTNNRTRREICSKLTTKTQERPLWRGSGVFNIDFEHISHLVLRSKVNLST